MLIFDLDGTLWDSAVQVADSWNIVLQKEAPQLGKITAGFVHSVMGRTMEEIAEITLPDEPVRARASLFKKCEVFEVEYISEHGGFLFDGVRETLEKLKNEGHSLAIVSNCQAGYVAAFIKSMKMKGLFCDTEEWGNTMLSKADNIRLVMERNHVMKAVYIGDTQKDLDAARGAKIPFIHAAYGFGTTDDPDMVINSIRELPALVERYK